jgi:uncharacterized protein YggE
VDKNLTTYLYYALIAALLVFMASSISLAASFARSSRANVTSFTVTGEGKASFAPDIATFNFGVITQGGNNVEDLQGENDKKINAMVDFIKQSGVDAKDIKTQDYSVNPRYSYGNDKAPTITGYEINQQIFVKVRDIKKAGEILSGVVKLGASNVSQLQFTIENIEDVKNQAKALAIENARKAARDMAKTGGFRMGKLIAIDEGSQGGPIPMFDTASPVGRGGDGASTALEPGQGEYTVSVVLKYEIR